VRPEINARRGGCAAVFAAAAIAAAVFSAAAAQETPRQSEPILITFTRITGITHIKNGDEILRTLTPGAAPAQPPANRIGVYVAEGRVEIAVSSCALSAAAGAEFTLSADTASVRIAVGSAAPAQLSNCAGRVAVITANSEFYFQTADGAVLFKTIKGKVLLSDPVSGETKVLADGDSQSVAAAPEKNGADKWQEKK